ncbi:MAG: hypothetical protein JOY59_08945, partial [Candidatus Eremiobacteraeota bacterium]|nr:hypothetical protein [Candidatus Eremiobacteraeota bacterium]
VGSQELAFDRDEIARVLDAAKLSGAVLDRIATLTRGWPIAVLLVGRLAKTRGWTTVLDEIDRLEWEDLYEYLAREVIAELDVDSVDVLVAAASIPLARNEDLALVLGAEKLAAARQLTEIPFLSIGEVVEVHPLMRGYLLADHASRATEILLVAAERWSDGGDPARAAELFLELGDQEAAAKEIAAKLDFVADPRNLQRAAAVVPRIDAAVVERNPILWAGRSTHRRYRDAPRANGLTALRLLRGFGEAAPPPVRSLLTSIGINEYLQAGDLEAARAELDNLLSYLPLQQPPRDMAEISLLYTWAAVTATSGRLQEAEEVLASLDSMLMHVPIFTTQLALSRAVLVERPRARAAAEYQGLLVAVTAAKASQLTNFYGHALMHATAGAWLRGDESALRGHVLELASLGEALPGLGTFTATFAGRRLAPDDFDGILEPELRGYAALAAAANASGDARRRLLEAAWRASSGTAHWFVRMLALVATARSDEGRSQHWIALAREAVAHVEAPALHESLKTLGGMLAPLVARFDGAAKRRVVAVEFATCSVTLDRERVRLSDRELQLLLAIAQRREGASREELATNVWPNLGGKNAIDAFNTTLHRLRRHFSPDDPIQRDGARYMLRSDVEVDLWRLEHALRGSDAAPFTEADFARFRAANRSHALRWPWFEPVDDRLQRVLHAAGLSLARDALSRGAIE